MKQSMSSQIAGLKQTLQMERGDHDRTRAKLNEINQQMRIIVGENESLRMDKKWLQGMHSCLLQTLHTKGL